MYYNNGVVTPVCLIHTARNLLWHWIWVISVSIPHCSKCTVTLNLWRDRVYSTLQGMYCDIEFVPPVCIFLTTGCELQHWIWNTSVSIPYFGEYTGTLNLGHQFLPLRHWGRRGFVVACVCPSVRPSVCLSLRKLFLIRTITRHRFGLESPNLHQTCILGYSQLVLKIEVIVIDPQCHFGHFDSEF